MQKNETKTGRNRKTKKKEEISNNLEEYYEKLVPDTSALIEEVLSNLIINYNVKVGEIYIHEAVLAELRHQASIGKITGSIGLSEIERLQELSKEKDFSLIFTGRRPTSSEIQFAPYGEIDNKIVDLAYDINGVLVTLDRVQAQVAKAKGIKVLFFEQKKELIDPIKDFFDENTMSVHIKANNYVYAKKGRPGNFVFEKLSEKPLSSEEVKELAKKIVEFGKIYGYIDQESEGTVVLQINNYRIVITKFPLSEDYEITIVKPVKKLSLEDYNLDERIIERLKERAEGILVAGAPGSGKSTFIQALIEFYYKNGKIIKTIESPRDLITPVGVTQYSLKHTTYNELRDVILLSRPDYVFFDEVRNVPDFLFYSDLRLAGVGMVGVIHATKAIDAIQRLIGKVELGMIPSIVDTVIFIDKGNVEKVYSLEYTVKVPSGMQDEDLARPVIEVKDFLTGKLEFEIYTYGEETVVMPVEAEEKKPSIFEYAEKELEKEINTLTGIKTRVKVKDLNSIVVYANKKDIPHLIGKEGRFIKELEEKLKLKIEVKNIDEIGEKFDEGVPFEVFEDKNYYYFEFEESVKEVDIFVDNKYFGRASVGKDNVLTIQKKNKTGKAIKKAFKKGRAVIFKKVK
ncbi:MAG TPA: ATPase [Nautiliaceae bacterium]|nr:ATPase [Nautiliaceae bacterium]